MILPIERGAGNEAARFHHPSLQCDDWPLAALAQQAGKVYRVGLIITTSAVSKLNGPEPVHPPTRAFVQGLRALGYVEGQNLILERRSAEGRFERLG